MTDLALMSCESLLGLYRSRQASPLEVLAAVERRIELHNGTLNAFAHLALDQAREAARDSERRWMEGKPAGALDGLPITVKDLGLTRNMPTLRGSLALDRGGPWNEDAPSVARARAQGAVLLGKTAVPEFGCKGTTDSRLLGVTRNPWNPELTPGGSSGGAVAAVATGMSSADIASDAGGSIRNPCALTGVVGLKPSFGRVPDYPPSPVGSMAVIGPICRTVRDAALFMNVLSQPDGRDPLSAPAEDFLGMVERDATDLRIAASATLGYARVEPQVLAVFEKVVAALGPLVRSAERVDEVLPDPAALVGAFLSVGASRVYRAYGLRKEQEAGMDPAFVGAVRRGETMTLQQYLDASAARRNLIETVTRLFQRFDLLVTPMLPCPAFPVGMDDPPADRFACGTYWKPFSGWVNLTKLPAVSVPCGLTREGLPIGLQIVGPRFAEGRVLRLARVIEKISEFVLPDFSGKIPGKTGELIHAN